jgi:hypothetical protein
VGKRGPAPVPNWLKELRGSRIRKRPGNTPTSAAVPLLGSSAEIPTAYDRWCFYFSQWVACKKALDAEGTFSSDKQNPVFQLMLKLEFVMLRLEARFPPSFEPVEPGLSPLGYLARKPKPN